MFLVLLFHKIKRKIRPYSPTYLQKVEKKNPVLCSLKFKLRVSYSLEFCLLVCCTRTAFLSCEKEKKKENKEKKRKQRKKKKVLKIKRGNCV